MCDLMAKIEIEEYRILDALHLNEEKIQSLTCPYSFLFSQTLVPTFWRLNYF